MSMFVIIIAFLFGLITSFTGCSTDVDAAVEVAPAPSAVVEGVAGTYAGQVVIATGDNEFLTFEISRLDAYGTHEASVSAADSEDVLLMPCSYAPPFLACTFQEDPDDEVLTFVGEINSESWTGISTLGQGDPVPFTLNRIGD